MERGIVFFMIATAILLVGGVFCTYQLYQLVQIDAKCRGLKHPKLWGLFAASGNNQSGIIFYLIARRKYPVISMSLEQKQEMERYKKRFSVGLLFVVIGGIICVLSMFLLNRG